MLARGLIWFELIVYLVLAGWMAVAMWKSALGDKRYGDTARLVVFSFSLLIAYRDWRILFVDASDGAKIIMVVLGVFLAMFTALAAKAYGRGSRLP